MTKPKKAFDGMAYECNGMELEDLYYSKKFTHDGNISFLKSLGIPVSYFKNQATNMKVLLLKNGLEQKKAQSDNPFLILETPNQEEVSYVKQRQIMDSNIELSDPASLLPEGNIILEKGSYAIEGEKAIYFGEQLLDKADKLWNSTSFHIKPFWDNGIKMENSILRIVCSNGMINQENIKTVSIPAKNISADVISVSYKAMAKSIEERATVVKANLKKLQAIPVTYEDTREIVEDMFSTQAIPKKTYDAVTKYLVAHGVLHGHLKGTQVIDLKPEVYLSKHDLAPVSFDKMWDVTNLITYFVSNELERSSVFRFQKKAYSYFFSPEVLESA